MCLLLQKTQMMLRMNYVNLDTDKVNGNKQLIIAGNQTEK